MNRDSCRHASCAVGSTAFELLQTEQAPNHAQRFDQRAELQLRPLSRPADVLNAAMDRAEAKG